MRSTRVARLLSRQLCTSTGTVLSTGLFGVPGFTTPQSLHVIGQHAVKKCDAIVEHVTSEPRPKDVILRLDELSSALCAVVDVAEVCRNVHPDPEYAQAANDVIMELSSYMQNLNTNINLYSALVNGNSPLFYD